MGTQDVYTVLYNMNGINVLSSGPLANDTVDRIKSILGGKLTIRDLPASQSATVLTDPTRTKVDIGHLIELVTTETSKIVEITAYHTVSDPVEASGILAPIHTVVV